MRRPDEEINKIVSYLLRHGATNQEDRVDAKNIRDVISTRRPLIEIIADPAVGGWTIPVDFEIYPECQLRELGHVTEIIPSQDSVRYIVKLSPDGKEITTVYRDNAGGSGIRIVSLGIPSNPDDIKNSVLYKSNKEFIQRELVPNAIPRY